ncbi:cytochrome C [Leptospira idonii]|uniref:Cytochrome C n=2 Tax=Leptospira idonii TaxID=1193500 RepID=A0A4R9LUE5_9LEPT|nr:cytochrome C [Leptospira idonii]
MFAFPKQEKPESITIERTSARWERGRYLANAVAACMDCHSQRDWNLYAGPIVPGSLGAGGEEFNQKLGFPGKYFAPNITPDSLGDWTDGEIKRAITTGVSKNGRPLFPVMPYLNYGKMDSEDIDSIIVYLRSLEPIKKEIPQSESDFPMNLIIRTIPTKANFTQIPKPSDRLEYGKYLFTAASCADCHTKQEKGKPIEGMELAGGFEFPMGDGSVVRSSNITPDRETGIGNWSEDRFVNLFKSFDSKTYKPHVVEKEGYNTIMPWGMYGNMTKEDLSAIFAYLQTVKPIRNEVIRFSK